MFCPHCGADQQKSEAYCTRCGMWLIDPGAVMRHGRRIPHTAKSPEQKLRAVIVFNVIDTLLALFTFFALLLRLRPDTHWTVIVAFATCLVIAVHQAVSFKFNLDLRSRMKRGREGAQGDAAQLHSAPTTERALGAGAAPTFNAPFSVAEQTTELLERVPRERGERR
ncbi:MAG: zinc ribbon domain-containing protein [Pyrinomonadaceae bacterium]